MTIDSNPTTTPFLPGPILLLGAPGVGKGTQAKVLMATFGIPQISTGDLLRIAKEQDTPFGHHVKDLLAKGILVSDDLVNQMVSDRLAAPDTGPGYILDGFPRTLAQAEWLDAKLASTPGTLPVVALSIEVDPTLLLERITGRRTSPAGRIYNIYSNPPRIPGHCDVDGSILEQRADDTEAVFHDRMDVFHAQTAPVVEHYRNQGRFAEIDGSASVEQVTAAIHTALQTLRGQKEV